MAGKISPHTLFTFDDVLILPAKSSIEPREATLETSIAPGIMLASPFLSAAMDRVTEATLAVALHRAGGLGVLHRNCTIVQQAEMVRRAKKENAIVAAACGPFDLERAVALADAGVDALVIDCAHGHNLKVVAAARGIRKRLKKIPLIVGNIATKEAVRDLRGVADAVKVGVGPGSICTTRIVSGVGVPQLSAILEVSAAAHRAGMRVIADGGMRTSGDIAKALAAGADAVMLGSLFAGAAEAPGRTVVRGGTRYKEYRGMGSASVLAERRANDRYLTQGRKAVAEGVEGLVPFRGPVGGIVEELSSGVQVSMGYVGARSLAEFHRRAQFIRITQASMQESAPHTITFQ